MSKFKVGDEVILHRKPDGWDCGIFKEEFGKVATVRSLVRNYYHICMNNSGHMWAADEDMLTFARGPW